MNDIFVCLQNKSKSYNGKTKGVLQELLKGNQAETSSSLIFCASTQQNQPMARKKRMKKLVTKKFTAELKRKTESRANGCARDQHWLKPHTRKGKPVSGKCRRNPGMVRRLRNYINK